MYVFFWPRKVKIAIFFILFSLWNAKCGMFQKTYFYLLKNIIFPNKLVWWWSRGKKTFSLSFVSKKMSPAYNVGRPSAAHHRHRPSAAHQSHHSAK
jgi:hypothetical protein